MNKYKSIFISDLHLGTSQCNIKELNKFLKENNSENLFLVGDIFDLWEFKQKRFFWTQETTNIIRTILGKAKHGTNVIYVSGNHDEDFRLLDNVDLGNVRLCHEFEYEAMDGRRILLIHGDILDAYMIMLKNHPRIDKLIGWIYRFILSMNILFRPIYRRNKSSFSQKLIGFLRKKKLMKNDHKHKVIDYCKLRGFDAIICGHSHNPEIDGNYMNCGDWVDHNSYIVETIEGNWELLK